MSSLSRHTLEWSHMFKNCHFVSNHKWAAGPCRRKSCWSHFYQTSSASASRVFSWRRSKVLMRVFRWKFVERKWKWNARPFSLRNHTQTACSDDKFHSLTELRSTDPSRPRDSVFLVRHSEKALPSGLLISNTMPRSMKCSKCSFSSNSGTVVISCPWVSEISIFLLSHKITICAFVTTYFAQKALGSRRFSVCPQVTPQQTTPTGG